MPNMKLTHGYPRYIAQVSASYLLGEPARYFGAEPAATALRALFAAAAADAVDLEIAVQQSVFGRGVSLCYENAAREPMICALNPRNSFVVYDDTVAHTPLFGVRLVERAAGTQITLYLPDRVAMYPQGNTKGHLAKPLLTRHPFGAVPMVEYKNGGDEHGDFEDVLSLVDAYDLLQSDRLNDRMQFSDALLVLTGVMGISADPDDTMSPMDRLRQEKTLALPDSDAKAEWLVKNPSEHDVDVLRRALAEDIHKFSLTPDFSDERFAGNASGISIKYKLFNFENRIKLKEKWFIDGLRERARVFCGFMQIRQGVSLDADELRIVLSRRLPINELERAQALSLLKDILPPATLLDNAPILPSNATLERSSQ